MQGTFFVQTVLKKKKPLTTLARIAHLTNCVGQVTGQGG